MQNGIDIVITWVDGNDAKWQQSKNIAYKEFFGIEAPEGSDARFRDWDNLQYVFRGIEKYMPWVRKIHFVTEGHLPRWLNTDNEKLHVVKHTDFIPKEYLPTFNSSVIELNLFRIEGLSEHFINFNDDMFVINETKPSDFFKNGLPCDMASISPPPVFRSSICSIENNNLQIINDHFDLSSVKQHPVKWLNPKYGAYLLRTLLFMNYSSILGLFVQHIPYSYNRSVIASVWEEEYSALDAACHNVFRQPSDLSEWLFREWQLMSNEFTPRRHDFGVLVHASDIDTVRGIMDSERYKLICINDDETVSDFHSCRDAVNTELNKKLPNKCSFEI